MYHIPPLEQLLFITGTQLNHLPYLPRRVAVVKKAEYNYLHFTVNVSLEHRRNSITSSKLWRTS